MWTHTKAPWVYLTFRHISYNAVKADSVSTYVGKVSHDWRELTCKSNASSNKRSIKTGTTITAASLTEKSVGVGELFLSYMISNTNAGATNKSNGTNVEVARVFADRSDNPGALAHASHRYRVSLSEWKSGLLKLPNNDAKQMAKTKFDVRTTGQNRRSMAGSHTTHHTRPNHKVTYNVRIDVLHTFESTIIKHIQMRTLSKAQRYSDQGFAISANHWSVVERTAIFWSTAATALPHCGGCMIFCQLTLFRTLHDRYDSKIFLSTVK